VLINPNPAETTMSLFGLIKGAVTGKNTWGDVGSKIESLLVTDVVDPLEALGEQFASDFGKAALAEAGTVVSTIAPEILADPAQTGSIIASNIPTVLTNLEQQGIKIAETDAVQEAQTVVGNALRVQVTAAQVAAPATPVTAATAAAVATAVSSAGQAATPAAV
jgi:hypothetical protein